MAPLAAMIAGTPQIDPVLESRSGQYENCTVGRSTILDAGEREVMRWKARAAIRNRERTSSDGPYTAAVSCVSFAESAFRVLNLFCSIVGQRFGLYPRSRAALTALAHMARRIGE
jgi:hypothetical protein